MTHGSCKTLPFLVASALVVLLSLATQAETATRYSSGSRVLCDLLKVSCDKKASKARSSKKKLKQTTRAKQVAKQTKKAKQTTKIQPPTEMRRKKRVVAETGETSKVSTSRKASASPIINSAKVLPRPKPEAPAPESQTSQLAGVGVAEPGAPFLNGDRLLTLHPRLRSAPEIVGCRQDLERLGVSFSVPDRVEGTGQCRVVDPVQLKSIKTVAGQVELPHHPILNCQFARKFAVWLSDIAAPVAAAHGEAPLLSLSTGSGYECRNRNGGMSDKISEHAFGNAIDIDGITLTNKKRIEIADAADDQDSDHRLLTALRTSACGYFTTVLGPGANEAHASHFHFDLGTHGKSGKHRICE
jgi:hypothetical protein